MLADARPIAFAATSDRERARAFYEGVLGLRLAEDGHFALVFDLAGAQLRVSIVSEVSPPPYTVLGWFVPDIEETVRTLRERGVSFERYPGMDQDAGGICTLPTGTRLAWFKDPDGNVLSVTEAR